MTNTQLASYPVGKIEDFPSIKSKTRMPTLTTFIQHSTGSPSQNNQARERKRMHPNQKERYQLSLLADNMNIYIDNLPSSQTPRTIKMNKLSKVRRYKTTIQNQLNFCTPIMIYPKKKSRKQSCLQDNFKYVTMKIKDLYIKL